MTARRIGGPGGERAVEPLVTFTFDGREVRGVEGEPLAVALLAAGRPVISRSFRFHRPRGLMCSTGQCGWCECEVDGVPSVRSCRVPAREGLVARGEHAWPSVGNDVLAALGMVSRWIPPTFYHHRFLRPRRLRKRYLDVLRRFGGRGRLRIGPRPDRLGERPVDAVETDVLVVGGGRAGLEAAIGAAGAGARVMLVEAERAIDTGRGAALGELEAEARRAGVDVRTGTTAIGWYDGVVNALSAGEHLEVAARSVVAATGSYDRVPLVPGADRPGVIAARTAIELVERHDVLPGERALLIGSGEELTRAGEVLAGAGVVELHGPVPTEALVAIRGSNGVTGAEVRIGGRRQHIAADVVVFGDRSPNLDLVLAAGAAIERRGETLIPVHDANGRTSVPTLFVAGSAAASPATDDTSAANARSTGNAAARAALGKRMPARARGAATPGTPSKSASSPIARGAIVCFCEDVRAWEIRAEQAAGYRDPELIKRRTGALTGPCQGKQCLQAFGCLTAPADGGSDRVSLPTGRPPLRPVRLGDLATSEDTGTAP